MRRRRFFVKCGVVSSVMLLATLGIVFSAPAASISGGVASDWFATAPGASDVYDGGVLATDIYQYIDPLTAQGQTGPGYGGQNYDAEAFLWTYDSGTGNTYIGIVTGFDPGGETSGAPAGAGGSFSAGDLFLDLGGANGSDFDLAIGLATDLGRSGSVYDADYGAANSTQSVYYDGTPPPDYAQHSDPYLAIHDNNVSPVSAVVNYINLAGDRWLYEICLAGFGYNPLAGSGVGLHWTMECGNDNMNHQAVVPVPAAAPLALLGMGVIGVVRRVRRREG